VERGDYSAVVYADVDVAKLVHHCCCEDEVPEGGLDMTCRRRDQIGDLKSGDSGEECRETRYWK
jgi:hypothetical protein